MKKLLLLFSIASLMSCETVLAQWNIPAKYVKAEKEKTKYGLAFPQGLVDFALTTPILTFTPFTQIEVNNGKAVLTNTIAVGYGLIYSPDANGTWVPDGSISSTNSRFFIGGSINYGLSFKDSVITGSVPVYLIAGWSNYGLGFGYDVMNNKTLMAVNVNFMGVPVLQGLTKVHLKQK